MPKSGEGSRGGTVVGHTKSGKAIYKHGRHVRHSSFNAQDHRDAANLHYDVTEKAHKRLAERREEDPKFKPTNQKGAREFIMHHHKMMVYHQRKANTAMDRAEDRQVRAETKQQDIEQRANLDSSWHDTLKTAYTAYDDRKKVTKGGMGSGRKGHKTEGLSEAQIHDRRTKFAGDQYAKFRHHSGEGLNDADKFKHGMVQDAKNAGYVKKSGYAGYTGADNARRKAGNIETGQSTDGAVGRRTKKYGGSGPSAAAKEASEMRRRSKKNPVKTWSPEEIAELNAKMKETSEKHGRGPDKGPRKQRVAKALELLDILEKAKYIKREGSKGNYKYTYKESGGKRKRRWDAKNFQEVKRDLEIIGDKDFTRIMEEIENEHPHGQFASDLAQNTMIEIAAGNNFDTAVYNASAEMLSENGKNIDTAPDEELRLVFTTGMNTLKMFRQKMDKLVLDIEAGRAKPSFTPKVGHEPIGLINPSHDDYDEIKAVATDLEYFKIDKAKEALVKKKVSELAGDQSEKAYHDHERSDKLFNELREIDPALSTALKTWTKHDNKRAKREELTKMATEVLKERAHLLPDAKGPMFRFPGVESGIIKDIVKNPEEYLDKGKKLKIKDNEFASFSTMQGKFAFDEAEAKRKGVMLWIDDEDNPGKFIGNLSAVGSESEAIIPPGTEFSVKSVDSTNDFIKNFPEDDVENIMSLVDILNENSGIKKIIHITRAKKAA